jgi:glycerol-3-phosphate cytidylyltransferase
MVADILHCGHVLAIEEARKNCDHLTVGLHCHPAYKDPQQTVYERFIQLRAVKWVDEVVPYENIVKDRNIFFSFPYDVYFLGEDHLGHPWEMEKEIRSLGKEIYFVKRKHEYSSSRIKKLTSQKNA